MGRKLDILSDSFDKNAVAYDKFRPTYSTQVIEKIIEYSGLKKGDSILEIGCGTGQLTIDLLDREMKVVAIEKGQALAKIARFKSRSFEGCQIINERFESWKSTTKFKAIFSAQAFHWIELKVGVHKVLEHLQTDGTFGLIWTVDESQETDFWQQSSIIYERYFGTYQNHVRLSQRISNITSYLINHRIFSQIQEYFIPYKKTYNKEQYLGLLRTYSSQMTINKEARQNFANEMTALITDFNNQVPRQLCTVIFLGRR